LEEGTEAMEISVAWKSVALIQRNSIALKAEGLV
jgi:hypothetical protein